MVKHVFVLFIYMIVSGGVTSAFAAEVGKPAPAFAVKDIAGNTALHFAVAGNYAAAVSMLLQYKGRIIVLEWNNPGCPFVKKHYNSGNMQSVQKYAISKGVVWLTVNSGAPGKEGYMNAAQAKATIKQVDGHETAYILDPEGTLGKLYGAKATPHMYVVDAHGILVYAGAIDDTPTADPEDITKAHNYVKAAIDNLLAGKEVEVVQTHAYGCSVKYKN